MNSRGQGISINVVVIAAIALIILVVLALLVFRSSKGVGEQTGSGSCLAKGGVCMAAAECPSVDGDYVLADTADEELNCKQGIERCCRYNFGG